MHALLNSVFQRLLCGLLAAPGIGLGSDRGLLTFLAQAADGPVHPAAGPGASFWVGGMAAGLLVGALLLLGLALYLRGQRRKNQLTPGDQAQQQPAGAQAARLAEGVSKRTTEAEEKTPAAATAAKPKRPVRSDGGALQAGLEKTRAGFIARLGELLRRKQIDADLLGQLEEVLLTADIGVKTATELFEQVRSSLSRQELKDPSAVWAVIKSESRKLLAVDTPPLDFGKHKPFVLLIVGVNGVGKTTTIGKLAAQLVAQGKKVILAAGDTFRAAAVEQLEIWGQRASVPVVRGKEGGDPSSVIFEAIKRAQREEIDVVIADTAGRLHVKAQLMEELQKVRRVIKKADPSAPHETF
ncbi:MAG TPA: signaling recognition particle receptor family protein, partial [Pseudomonadota bacterium]|nr:signaling recognition particle receptor family protein [Pseudomonadota bacterium]